MRSFGHQLADNAEERLITVLSLGALACLIALLSLAIVPVLAAQTLDSSVSISHIGPVWKPDETILVPPNTKIIPLGEIEYKGNRYVRSGSEYGEIYVPKDKVRIVYLEVPYKTRLGWILGWNIAEDKSGNLRVWYNGIGYVWVRDYRGVLRETQYTSVWRYLASGWVLVMMALTLVRFGRYDMSSDSHVKAIVGSLALVASMGLVNTGLWILFLVNKASFVSALAGVGANVFNMGLVTIGCREPSEETIRHKSASILIATVGMTILGKYLESGLDVWELMLLASPIGILYAVSEAVLSRLLLKN